MQDEAGNGTPGSAVQAPESRLHAAQHEIALWTRALLRVGGPIVLMLLLLAYVFLRHSEQWTDLLFFMVLYTFTFAGKFSAAGFIGLGVPPAETVFIFGTIDVILALFLVHNFPLVHRIPRIGAALQRNEERGRRILEKRGWVRRGAFVGLVLLVAIPFQGTGAVIGSLVGRILGMGPWRTVAAVALGGYGGVAIIALGTHRATRLLPDETWTAFAACLLLALFLLAALWWPHLRRARGDPLRQHP